MPSVRSTRLIQLKSANFIWFIWVLIKPLLAIHLATSKRAPNHFLMSSDRLWTYSDRCHLNNQSHQTDWVQGIWVFLASKDLNFKIQRLFGKEVLMIFRDFRGAVWKRATDLRLNRLNPIETHLWSIEIIGSISECLRYSSRGYWKRPTLEWSGYVVNLHCGFSRWIQGIGSRWFQSSRSVWVKVIGHN